MIIKFIAIRWMILESSGTTRKENSQAKMDKNGTFQTEFQAVKARMPSVHSWVFSSKSPYSWPCLMDLEMIHQLHPVALWLCLKLEYLAVNRSFFQAKWWETLKLTFNMFEQNLAWFDEHWHNIQNNKSTNFPVGLRLWIDFVNLHRQVKITICHSCQSRR